jgi:hypothetical protein
MAPELILSHVRQKPDMQLGPAAFAVSNFLMGWDEGGDVNNRPKKLQGL